MKFRNTHSKVFVKLLPVIFQTFKQRVKILLPLLLRETLYEPTVSLFSLFFFCKKVKPTSNDHILLTTIHTCRTRRRGDGMLHMLAACRRLASLNATTPSSRKSWSEAYQSQIAVASVNGTVVAWWWQGNGMVCVNRSLKRQGNGMGTAWERHGMCESALNVVRCRLIFVDLQWGFSKF
jgi:hypothetical protein